MAKVNRRDRIIPDSLTRLLSRWIVNIIRRYSSAFVGLLLFAWVMALPSDGAEATDPPVKPYPGGVQADLWFLAGQSNMQGCGMLKAPIPTDPRIMVFTREEKWELAEEPLDKEVGVLAAEGKIRDNLRLQKGGVTMPPGLTTEKFLSEVEARGRTLIGVGPGLAFAKHLLTVIDRPLGLIFTPYGGTSMAHWDPAASDPQLKLYPIMMRRVRMVGGKLKGVLWYQGEAESSPQASQVYEERLLNFIDCLRRDVGQPDLPFIYVQIGRVATPPGPAGEHGGAESWERVREIQRTVADQRKNVYIVPVAKPQFSISEND